jgi:PhnB protein
VTDPRGGAPLPGPRWPHRRERAVAAGAEAIYPLEDQFYGERGGRLRDPFGHQWMLSQHIEELTVEEMDLRAQAYFGQSG